MWELVRILRHKLSLMCTCQWNPTMMQLPQNLLVQLILYLVWHLQLDATSWILPLFHVIPTLQTFLETFVTKLRRLLCSCQQPKSILRNWRHVDGDSLHQLASYLQVLAMYFHPSWSLMDHLWRRRRRRPRVWDQLKLPYKWSQLRFHHHKCS